MPLRSEAWISSCGSEEKVTTHRLRRPLSAGAAYVDTVLHTTSGTYRRAVFHRVSWITRPWRCRVHDRWLEGDDASSLTRGLIIRPLLQCGCSSTLQDTISRLSVSAQWWTMLHVSICASRPRSIHSLKSRRPTAASSIGQVLVCIGFTLDEERYTTLNQREIHE